MDDRIKLLAVEIANKRPPAIVVRNMINELVEKFIKEGVIDKEYWQANSERYVTRTFYRGYNDVVPYFVPESVAEYMQSQDDKQREVYELASHCDCETCKEIAGMTQPITIG